MERERRTVSGPLLEIDFFPVFENGRRMFRHAPKESMSSEAQKRYNQIQAQKKLVRLVNANFNHTDYFAHYTYRPEDAPQSEEEARADMRNHLRRVKRKRTAEYERVCREIEDTKELLRSNPDNKFLQDTLNRLSDEVKKLKEPFKYIYVIECVRYRSGINKDRMNWHFHLFMTGGLKDKLIESLWVNGGRMNCNNFQPDKFGPEAAAKYMAKDPQGSRRFSCSKNLDKPMVVAKDGKLTRQGVERIAKQRINDKEYWEKKYKGYRFLQCYARFNDYNEHWYISVVMYKSDEKAPPWSATEWIGVDWNEPEACGEYPPRSAFF